MISDPLDTSLVHSPIKLPNCGFELDVATQLLCENNTVNVHIQHLVIKFLYDLVEMQTSVRRVYLWMPQQKSTVQIFINHIHSVFADEA